VADRTNLKRELNARNILFSALLGASALFVTACSGRLPQNTLDPAGKGARDIKNLIVPVFFVAGAIFVVVQTILLVSAFRFRQRGDAEKTEGPAECPEQIHGNTPLEVVWTIIPFLILVVIAIPTVRLIFEQHKVPESGSVLEIKVTGHQWWWEYEYPEFGIRTANEIHIPAGRPVKLTLTSQDVVHSFWIPRLAGKQDVFPGQERFLVLQADRELVAHSDDGSGTVLYGQCVEFCGISHANMKLRAVVQSDEDFQAWVASQKAPAKVPEPGTKAAEGKRIFESSACIGCHTIAGGPAQGRVGPDLTHFASRSTFAGSLFERTDENVAAWLRNPPGQKPGSKMPNLGLSESEIEALVAYLQSLE
jgi:cytochrome c oxidase subunit 2